MLGGGTEGQVWEGGKIKLKFVSTNSCTYKCDVYRNSDCHNLT